MLAESAASGTAAYADELTVDVVGVAGTVAWTLLDNRCTWMNCLNGNGLSTGTWEIAD